MVHEVDAPRSRARLFLCLPALQKEEMAANLRPCFHGRNEFYRPRPYSRSYVVHLDDWYAQSHPDEDFAETFAVWLTPGLDWRGRYRGWKAMQKLECVDDLMRSIAGKPPVH